MNPTVGQNISADEALALAHVRKIKGFYLHVAQYIIVLGFLTAVNFYTKRHSHYQAYWVTWVALGWAVGLLLHGLRAFDKIPFLSGERERRQVEKQLGRKL